MSPKAMPDWHRLLVLYWITSFVEGLGVAQIYAFLPNRLAEVGVASPDIGHLVGWLGSNGAGRSAGPDDRLAVEVRNVRLG